MAVLGWAWLASPFALIGVISREPRLLRLVAAHLERCRIAGGFGVLLLVLSATVVRGVVGEAMFWIGTPLIGLLVWLRGNDDDGGDERDPDVPPIDWDQFERAFRSYADRRRGSSPRGPVTPTR